MTAMFLEDENNETGWYTSYAEKLIRPVIAWFDSSNTKYKK